MCPRLWWRSRCCDRGGSARTCWGYVWLPEYYSPTLLSRCGLKKMGSQGLLPSPSCQNGRPIPRASRTRRGTRSNAPQEETKHELPINYHAGAVPDCHPIKRWITGMQGPTSGGNPVAICLGDKTAKTGSNLGAPDSCLTGPESVHKGSRGCGCSNYFPLRDTSWGGTRTGTGNYEKRLRQEVEWMGNCSIVREAGTDCHRDDGDPPLV
mmetsp:Transcript_56813/g.101348  ORF Transcript_56813/g.101348 Transcript_56813/m.101348 type:complete len:209 (-) Transcript_56813:1032-1658(-)